MQTPLDLLGAGVLVTRPEQQAGPFRRLIEASGGNAFLLSAVEIKARPLRRELLTAGRDIGSFDLIVFVSANAVRFGAELLEQRRDLTLAAIGPATMRSLNQSGYRVSVAAEKGFDSEHLLEHSIFQHLHSKRVMLVKGGGGRDVLEHELRRRGAEVILAEVYTREIARPSDAKLAALDRALSEDRIQVVTAGSLELGANLLTLTAPLASRALQALPWTVPSERVAAGLRELGVRGDFGIASSAEDHDMLRAVSRCLARVSGA